MDANKQFEDFFTKHCVPVSDDEVVKPTRVVFRKCGTVTTRIFPTQARAWAFAAEVKHLMLVQDASEPVPPQSQIRQASNETFARYGLIRGWWKK